ncbi:unnamed protein product, partial [Amoebophrya sp. A25]
VKCTSFTHFYPPWVFLFVVSQIMPRKIAQLVLTMLSTSKSLSPLHKDLLLILLYCYHTPRFLVCNPSPAPRAICILNFLHKSIDLLNIHAICRKDQYLKDYMITWRLNPKINIVNYTKTLKTNLTNSTLQCKCHYFQTLLPSYFFQLGHLSFSCSVENFCSLVPQEEKQTLKYYSMFFNRKCRFSNKLDFWKLTEEAP